MAATGLTLFPDTVQPLLVRDGDPRIARVRGLVRGLIMRPLESDVCGLTWISVIGDDVALMATLAKVVALKISAGAVSKAFDLDAKISPLRSGNTCEDRQ